MSIVPLQGHLLVNLSIQEAKVKFQKVSLFLLSEEGKVTLQKSFVTKCCWYMSLRSLAMMKAPLFDQNIRDLVHRSQASL